MREVPDDGSVNVTHLQEVVTGRLCSPRSESPKNRPTVQLARRGLAGCCVFLGGRAV